MTLTNQSIFEVAKTTHVTMVIATVSLLLIRAQWAFRGSPLLRHPVVRWLPHVVDTLLLASALTAAATLGQFPFLDGWLTAKFFALLAYIILGHITLWRVKSNGQRAAALAATLAVFIYIVAVARCHDPFAGLAVCFG